MSNEAKNSSVAWIGKKPLNWQSAKLKYLIKSASSGGTPDSSNDDFYSHTGVPWTTISDITNSSQIKDTAKHITDKALKDKNLKIYPKGTILLAMYASVGKVAELCTEASVNQAILAISVDTSKVTNDYIKFCFNAYEPYITSESNGTTQFNLNASKVLNLSFPLPSLEEQDKISKEISKKSSVIDQLISNQEKQIEKLKEYRQAIITKAVTKGLDPNAPMKDSGVEWIGEIPSIWITPKFKNLAVLSNGKEIEEDGGDIPVYGSGGIFKYTSHPLFDGISLLTGRKGTIDNPMLVSGAFWTVDTMFYTSAINLKNVLPEYLFYAFKGCCNFNFYKSGSVLPSMTQSQINNIIIPLPPLYEQKNIVDFLQAKMGQIDLLLSLFNKNTEKLKSYKQSLIYEYVTGKKRVSL